MCKGVGLAFLLSIKIIVPFIHCTETLPFTLLQNHYNIQKRRYKMDATNIEKYSF